MFGPISKTTRHAHLYFTSKSFINQRDALQREKAILEAEDKPFKLDIASPPPLEKIHNEANVSF